MIDKHGIDKMRFLANGPACADKAYGLKHSNGFPPKDRRWIARQERTIVNSGFIPSGAITDIIDDNFFSPVPEPPNIIDPFFNNNTEGQILTSLGAGITTPLQFRNAFLAASVPSGQFTTDYITLMASYGL